MTRGRLHTGGRSTSVVAAATSTLIGLTSYHLRERNVMNSRFVGSTAKIPEECPMIFLFFPPYFLLLLLLYIPAIHDHSLPTLFEHICCIFSFFDNVPGFLRPAWLLNVFLSFSVTFFIFAIYGELFKYDVI